MPLKGSERSKNSIADAVRSVNEECLAAARLEMSSFYDDYAALIAELAANGWKRFPTRNANCFDGEDSSALPDFCYVDGKVDKLVLQESCFLSRWDLWKARNGAKYQEDIAFKLMELKVGTTKEHTLKSHALYRGKGNVSTGTVLEEQEQLTRELLHADLRMDLNQAATSKDFIKKQISAVAPAPAPVPAPAPAPALASTPETLVAPTSTPSSDDQSTSAVTVEPVVTKTSAYYRRMHHQQLGIDHEAIVSSTQRENAQGGMPSNRTAKYSKTQTQAHVFHAYDDDREPEYEDEYPDEEEYQRKHKPMLKQSILGMPEIRSNDQPDAVTETEDVSGSDIDSGVVSIPGKKPTRNKASSVQIGIASIKPIVGIKAATKNMPPLESDVEMYDIQKGASGDTHFEHEGRSSVFESANPLHQ